MKSYTFNQSLSSFFLFFAVIFFVSCKKDPITPEPLPPPVVPPIVITPAPPVVKPNLVFFALNTSNQLIRYNANAVETAQSTIAINGLQSGENIVAIDFRPATGELYGLSSGSRLYIININTGMARIVGTAPFTPDLPSGSVAFDFNPTVDRIRLVTSTGQNLRLNPETGTVIATDGNINGTVGANISGAAYSGNIAGSTNTVLYDIDITSQKLFRQNPPNNGTLVEIGMLGVPALGESGFDISPDGTVALAALNVGGQNNLYLIDTSSGKANLLGTLRSALPIRSIAIPTNSVAYTLDNVNNILIFNISSPATISTKAITGLLAGDTLLGLDFRPLNGQLYALGSTSRLYTINASSGAATVVGTAPFATRLLGSNFGFDFNPVPDRIRVVSDRGQNLRLHPDLGTVAFVDGNLKPGTPTISAAAYTNNFAGTTTTTLFVIDHATDKLFIQNPPNDGTLVEVGSLGINIEAANGFDIGSNSGIAYAILQVGTTQALYSINLTTGAATKLNDFSRPVRGFTIGLGF
jgi:hypothetical protein